MKDYKEVDFSSLSKEEKKLLKQWAIKVMKIRDNESYSFKEKLNALKKLNNKEAFKASLNIATEYSKKYWKKASWAEKLGIIGGGGAIALFGFGGAGVAALGGAIGLPLFLLTAAGGTFIGTIIDKLDK